MYFLWLTLFLLPSIFWFFLVRKFNTKTKSRFPAFIYSILYFIPGVHLFTSWSFISDLQENKKDIPKAKLYFLNLAVPYLLVILGPYIATVLGAVLLAVGIALGENLINIAGYTFLLGSVWLAWGFKSLYDKI